MNSTYRYIFLRNVSLRPMSQEVDSNSHTIYFESHGPVNALDVFIKLKLEITDDNKYKYLARLINHLKRVVPL